MEIRNNTIIFKSDDEYYFKEKAGIKPNTVRYFSDLVELEAMINFHDEIEEELKYIEIHNRISPHLFFKRQIRDMSKLPGKWCWVISWFHEENGVREGFNAPIQTGHRNWG